VDLYSVLRENTSNAVFALKTIRTAVSLKIVWNCLC